MKKEEIKILFFGTPKFSLPALTQLKENDFNIIGVVTQPDKPAGRKKILTPPPIKLLAEKLQLPVYQWEKNDKEVLEKINKIKPDLIVVVAYGKILPKELVNLPPYGCLNLHPSLLPKYRGPSPIQTAILNGETKTGVTIIKLDQETDHGPIVAQKEFDILEDDDYESLSNSLACEGAEVLVKIIPNYIAGEIKPKEQNHAQATESKIIEKNDGEINWQKNPAEIDQQIRAYHPWPGAWTEATGKRVKILKAHLENGELFLDWVQPEGKEPMRYDDFLNGNEPLF
jgi:methionyl-tRNA formyltransferase